jgi:hypothetical protein
MRRFNLSKFATILAVGGTLALVSPLSEPSFAQTQVNSPRQGLPGRRISGGSRSPDTACLTTPNQPLVALMPKNNVGLTVSAHPTLWFSIPAISSDRVLEFGLYDPSGELLYTTTFGASEKAEVVSLPLPETSSPLVIDKDYRWYLSVVCNQESRAEDLVVTGWVRRVQPNPTLTEQLANADAQERSAIYEKSELWCDALTSLAELRRSTPVTDITEALEQQWISLLESVELSQVIAAPLGSELTPATHLAQNPPFLQD